MDVKEKLEYLINEGLTVNFIAKRCGINVGTLYNFRKSNQKMSEEKMDKLINFINDCEVFLNL